MMLPGGSLVVGQGSEQDYQLDPWITVGPETIFWLVVWAVIYVALAIVVARAGRARGESFGMLLFVGIVATPVVSLLLLIGLVLRTERR